MKLYLNKPCENGDRYFIDNKHVGIIWLEDEKDTEYYVGTFDEAYAVIRLLDRETNRYRAFLCSTYGR